MRFSLAAIRRCPYCIAQGVANLVSEDVRVAFNIFHANSMKRLDLDRVWWVVTPGNPLKDTGALTGLEDRIRAIKAFTNHPRIEVTGFEATIGSRYTFETVSFLRRRCPGVRFVWIMGADNLRNFHRWKNWRGRFLSAATGRLSPTLMNCFAFAGLRDGLR